MKKYKRTKKNNEPEPRRFTCGEGGLKIDLAHDDMKKTYRKIGSYLVSRRIENFMKQFNISTVEAVENLPSWRPIHQELNNNYKPGDPQSERFTTTRINKLEMFLKQINLFFDPYYMGEIPRLYLPEREMLYQLENELLRIASVKDSTAQLHSGSLVDPALFTQSVQFAHGFRDEKGVLTSKGRMLPCIDIENRIQSTKNRLLRKRIEQGKKDQEAQNLIRTKQQEQKKRSIRERSRSPYDDQIEAIGGRI